MKIRTMVFLFTTHCMVAIIGFGLGIYALPIITAPPAPSASEVEALATQAEYNAEFRRNLKDSDALHWGEGTVSISSNSITLMGSLSPGPDYKLYLSPTFIETEADFNRLKSEMLRVGDVKTFENFVVHIPANIELAKFNSIIVWCESFGEFITSAKYKE